jgi:DNA-directed RNA polymerase subunit F
MISQSEFNEAQMLNLLQISPQRESDISTILATAN